MPSFFGAAEPAPIQNTSYVDMDYLEELCRDLQLTMCSEGIMSEHDFVLKVRAFLENKGF